MTILASTRQLTARLSAARLREEAYVADRLAQLEEQVVRFLSDRSRNRYYGATHTLEVSEIFDWYREDFSSGFQGIRSREQFFAKYAELLADDRTVMRYTNQP